MSETASAEPQHTNTADGPRMYWRLSGLALTAVAVVGIVANAVEGNNVWIIDDGLASVLAFDWTHNGVHVVLAAIALFFGYARVGEQASRNMARVIGVTYMGLGVLGFVPAVDTWLADTLALHLEWGENVLHLGLGAWAAWVGFTS